MSPAGVARACFKHRYSALLEQGLADDSTKTIDRDTLQYYESAGRDQKTIAKILKVTKDDIKFAKSLERRLVVQDRERALTALDSEPVAPAEPEPAREQSPEDFVHEALTAVDVPARSEEKVNGGPVAVVSYVGTSALRIGLMTMWCQARGLESKVVFVQDGSVLDRAIASKGCGRVVLWDHQGDIPSVVEGLVGSGAIGGVDYLDTRAAWEGLFDPDVDGNDSVSRPINNRWLGFCWDHMRQSNAKRIAGGANPTRFASLEDVMECARLGIPLWAVAKAVGCPTRDLDNALVDEGFAEDYVLYQIGWMGQDDASSESEAVPVAPVVEAPRTPASVGSEPVETSEVQTESAPESTPESIGPKADVPVPVVDDGVVADADAQRPAPTDDGPVTSGSEVIVIREPLITRSGARSIVATIRSGQTPDEDLWTRSGDGWIIRSYRANIAYRDGVAAYCIGAESVIRSVSFAEVDRDVLFDRDGLQYRMVGTLTLLLSDHTAVGVPVVSDYPIRPKRWLA